MKRKSFFRAFVFAVSGGLCFPQPIVHDPVNNIPIVSTWLGMIDTLYANYDMIANSITQIENQYRTIQQAIENAKGIDWENITFDGDFDIRDDIRNANRRVNALLTQANTIKNTLTTSIIDAGGTSYSLADICGHGDEDKDFASCVDDVYGYMKRNMLSAANIAVNGLSPAQEKAIWVKYGISPQNYYLASQTASLVRNAAKKCIAEATDEAKAMKYNDRLARTSKILAAALDTKTSDGTVSQGAYQEAMMLVTEEMVQNCISLEQAIDRFNNVIAQKIIQEEQQNEIKASEKQAEENGEQILEGNVPANFAAGETEVM